MQKLASQKPASRASVSERPRINSGDRREAIVSAAVSIFAEHGLQANTTLLAQRLKVTQPLMYKYFPTKDDLIEAVFARMYGGHLEIPTTGLLDRSRPVDERIAAHYRTYIQKRFSREWVRIFAWSGLAGDDRAGNYLQRAVEPSLRMIGREILLEAGSEDDLNADQLHVLWGLHGGLHYAAIRRNVYGLKMPLPSDAAILGCARGTIAGVVSLISRVSPKATAAKRFKKP